jgi:hypothetical protein
MQVLRKLHFDGTNEDWIEREFNEMRLTIEAEKAITAPGWAIMFKVDPWRTRLFHATSIQLFGADDWVRISSMQKVCAD